MKRLAVFLALLLLVATPAVADTLYLPSVAGGNPMWFFRVVGGLDGEADLVGGVFPVVLGRVSSDCSDTDSIVCPDGPYGSADSEKSLSNPDGPYGSADSDVSAYDVGAQHPPRIIRCERGICRTVWYVTRNPAISPRLDPEMLLSVLRAKGECD
jgi:hypothetical protein